MHRDDYEFLTLGLLALNLAALYVIGEMLWRELGRPPRVIRIYEGGKGNVAADGTAMAADAAPTTAHESA